MKINCSKRREQALKIIFGQIQKKLKEKLSISLSNITTTSTWARKSYCIEKIGLQIMHADEVMLSKDWLAAAVPNYWQHLICTYYNKYLCLPLSAVFKYMLHQNQKRHGFRNIQPLNSTEWDVNITKCIHGVKLIQNTIYTEISTPCFKKKHPLILLAVSWGIVVRF